jgi:hypothetical protein
MVGGASLVRIAAIGRQCNEDVAKLRDPESEGAGADIGIVSGIAPSRRNAASNFAR